MCIALDFGGAKLTFFLNLQVGNREAARLASERPS
jgi:hypothetical protein